MPQQARPMTLLRRLKLEQEKKPKPKKMLKYREERFRGKQMEVKEEHPALSKRNQTQRFAVQNPSCETLGLTGDRRIDV
ncbi:hypothetical protein D1872_320540 [compost metagenome]